MLTDLVLKEVLNKVKIVDVIIEHVALKKRGMNYVGFSPFEKEKTASFIVSPDLKCYKCFVTGKKGNTIDFIKEFKQISYDEALLELAKKLNIFIFEMN